MNWIKTHWVWVSGVLTLIVPFEVPAFNAYIAAHPHTTFSVLLSAIVAAYYKQSPLGK